MWRNMFPEWDIFFFDIASCASMITIINRASCRSFFDVWEINLHVTFLWPCETRSYHVHEQSSTYFKYRNHLVTSNRCWVSRKVHDRANFTSAALRINHAFFTCGMRSGWQIAGIDARSPWWIIVTAWQATNIESNYGNALSCNLFALLNNEDTQVARKDPTLIVARMVQRERDELGEGAEIQRDRDT